jgi:hypothetical protein
MKQYFAKLPPLELLPELKKRWSDYQEWLKKSGFADRIRKSYASYYGLDKKGSMGIQKSEDGSIVHVNINHHKRLLTLQRQAVTGNKLSFFAQARVSDSDALAASVLGKSVADYYTEELKISKQMASFVDMALVCQKAYAVVGWNKGLGREIRPDGLAPEQALNTVKAGDNYIELLTPFDVAESTRTKKSPWKITRERVNRFDLIAEHPEHAEYLTEASDDTGDDEALNFALNFDSTNNKADDEIIYLYTFYHECTPAMPEGLIVKWVCDQIIEMEPLDTVYEHVPVFTLTAGSVIDSVAAHGTGIDLLAIQDVLTALFTAVVTNNVNLAMINIYGKDPNTKKTQIAEGMNLWTGTEPPTALALANSSPETYQLIEMLIGQANQTSGQNELTSGNVSDTKLSSGNALVVLLTTALQFVSDIQRDYADAVSDVMTQLIKNIRLNCKVEMVATIAGKTNRNYSKAFTAKDLYGIDKIKVELQNPVMATQAGRSQVAEALLNAQMLDDPHDYVTVLTTGDLPSGTDGALSLKQGIQEENERLKDGEPVPVLISDRHDIHAPSHLAQLNDPETRKRPELVDNILAHVQEHISQWQDLSINNPSLLALLGMEPAPMPPAPPPSDQGGQPEQIDDMPAEESNMPSMPNLPDGAPEQSQATLDQFQADLPPQAQAITN